MSDSTLLLINAALVSIRNIKTLSSKLFTISLCGFLTHFTTLLNQPAQFGDPQTVMISSLFYHH